MAETNRPKRTRATDGERSRENCKRTPCLLRGSMAMLPGEAPQMRAHARQRRLRQLVSSPFCCVLVRLDQGPELREQRFKVAVRARGRGRATRKEGASHHRAQCLLVPGLCECVLDTRARRQTGKAVGGHCDGAWERRDRWPAAEEGKGSCGRGWQGRVGELPYGSRVGIKSQNTVKRQ